MKDYSQLIKSSEETEILEGWSMPVGSIESHYFKGEQSLCGDWDLFYNEWAFIGSDTGEIYESDCKICRKKFQEGKDLKSTTAETNIS